MKDASPRRSPYKGWILINLAWLGWIAFRAVEGWPTMPLDMDGADPSTAAAYQAAQFRHVVLALGAAASLPLVTLAVLKLKYRERRHKPR